MPKFALPAPAIDPRLDLPEAYRVARGLELADLRGRHLAALEGVRVRARRVQWERFLMKRSLSRRRSWFGCAVVASRHARVDGGRGRRAYVWLYVLIRGSFDGTSINTRVDWITASLVIGGIAAMMGFALHRIAFSRDLKRAAEDELLLAFAGILADMVHAATFGWPMGYPLPRGELMFVPFFLCAFVVMHASMALLLHVGVMLKGRGSGSAGTSPST